MESFGLQRRIIQPASVKRHLINSEQLTIEGDGLSCGYLNNPELTAEKFYLTGGALFVETIPFNYLLKGQGKNHITSHHHTGIQSSSQAAQPFLAVGGRVKLFFFSWSDRIIISWLQFLDIP